MTRFLDIQEILEIHDSLIDSYGGLFGLRDLGLLASAVEIPKAKISKKFLHPTLFNQAAAYLFHICNNHPFLDGNKRTATASALVFLENNLVALDFHGEELKQLVLLTANGKANKDMLSAFFQQSQV